MSAIGKILGGRRAERVLESFRPAGFSSAGLTGRFADNTFSVTRGSEASSALSGLASGFRERAAAGTAAAGQFARLRPGFSSLQDIVRGTTAEGVSALGGLRGELSALRGEIRPGFGRLTESRIAGLRDQQRRSVGNLREELSRRRVMGSSFAAREVAALEAEFARQEDMIRAESFLTELGMSAELIAQEAGLIGSQTEMQQQGAQLIADFLTAEGGLVAQEFAARADAANASVESALRLLEQLNFETGLAAQLANAASAQTQANLQAQAQARQFSANLGMDFLEFLFPSSGE